MQATRVVDRIQDQADYQTAPSEDGQVLAWNATASKFEPRTPAAGGVTSVDLAPANTSLTVSPTTGDVKLSINLANSNTFTVAQGINANSTTAFKVEQSSNNTLVVDTTNKRVGVGLAPTSGLTLAAGSTSQAPMQLTSGALKTAAVAGGVEFLTDKAYLTITTGTARKEIMLADVALTAGRVTHSTTNGRQTDSANLTFDGTNLAVGGYVQAGAVGQSYVTKGFIINNGGGNVSTDALQVKGLADASLIHTDPANDRVGIGTSSPAVKLDINSDLMRLRTAKTPASAAAAGVVGSICWDADYVYVCVATDTWKRVAIATWP